MNGDAHTRRFIRPLLLAPLLALAGVSPAAEPTLEERLEHAWSTEDWSTAEGLLEARHQRQPDDPATLRRWGMAAAYQGRYATALERLEAAHERAPEDTDIRLARARVHAWRGDLATAEAQVEAIRADHPELAEAQDLAAQFTTFRAGHTPWRFTVGHARSEVRIGDDARLPWRETDLTAAYTFGEPTRPRPVTLTGRLHLADRDGDSDQQLNLGAVRTLASGPIVRGAFGIARKGNYLPEFHWMAGINLRLRPDSGHLGETRLDGAIDRRHYADGDTLVLAPTLHQAFFPAPEGARLWARLRPQAVNGSDNQWRSGYLVRLDARVLSHWTVYGGQNVAYEHDGTLVGQNESEVRSLFFGASRQFGPRHRLECGVTREEREHALDWRRVEWRCAIDSRQ